MDRFLTKVYNYAFATGLVATTIVSVDKIPSSILVIVIVSLVMSFLNPRIRLPDAAIPRDDWSHNRKLEHVVLSGLESGAVWSMGFVLVKWALRAIFF